VKGKRRGRGKLKKIKQAFSVANKGGRSRFVGEREVCMGTWSAARSDKNSGRNSGLGGHQKLGGVSGGAEIGRGEPIAGTVGLKCLPGVSRRQCVLGKRLPVGGVHPREGKEGVGEMLIEVGPTERGYSGRCCTICHKGPVG